MYWKAYEALKEAHDVVYKAYCSDPDAHTLGISHGEFSGVNVALGIIRTLEDELIELNSEVKIPSEFK